MLTEHRYTISVSINKVEQSSLLKPLVDRLAEAYANANAAGIIYGEADVTIFQIFVKAAEDTVNPGLDYCTTVTGFFSWLCGVKDKAI